LEWFVRAFIKASLAWLGLGVTLGVAMAAQPAWIVYRPAHVHMNLLGFVTMMIYGIGYHVLPRFSGHPLQHRWLAGLHWALANLGVAAMVAGFGLQPHLGARATPVLAGGGMLSALGAYLFILNMWRTINGPAPRRRPLPVVVR
jgi:cbb3-type cytochrome oxidase subunit 1